MDDPCITVKIQNHIYNLWNLPCFKELKHVCFLGATDSNQAIKNLPLWPVYDWFPDCEGVLGRCLDSVGCGGCLGGGCDILTGTGGPCSICVKKFIIYFDHTQ